ncbi:MAG TPA: nucleotidyltransferase family protein [Candidatus Acidoferrales bacterium]|nr:nucleotidyltransferase family protein [Candidatus Acidoferrales bacterium]
MEIPASIESSHQVENDLILACAATVVTEDRRTTLRHLANECRDWAYFIESCRAHGVSSLVCFTLEANAPDLVPKEIREVLQVCFKTNACRNLFLTQELVSQVRIFRENGIAAIPFKGPLLAIIAYGNVALREFLDLDILVQKKDFHRARELLATQGYRSPIARAGQPTESHFKSQLGCNHIRQDGRVSLEIHWSFVQKWLGFNVDLDAIWAAPRTVKVGQEQVLVLPGDITLLYLCAHGAKHQWNRLCWLVDVAEVLRTRSEWDWEALLAQAERSGCLRTLFIGLHLAKTLLTASVPDSVWAAIQRDKVAVSMAGTLEKQMFAARSDSYHVPVGWSRDWFHIRTKERWHEKLVYLGYLASWIFQPSDADRKWIRLPCLLRWLYVFLRPVRVAWQSLPPIASK